MLERKTDWLDRKREFAPGVPHDAEIVLYGDALATIMECLSWCPDSVESRGHSALRRALARQERNEIAAEEATWD